MILPCALALDIRDAKECNIRTDDSACTCAPELHTSE